MKRLEYLAKRHSALKTRQDYSGRIFNARYYSTSPDVSRLANLLRAPSARLFDESNINADIFSLLCENFQEQDAVLRIRRPAMEGGSIE